MNSELTPTDPRPRRRSNHVFPALVVIALGLALLAHNLGWIHASIAVFWPLFIVAIGIPMLFRGCVGSAIWGAALIVFGTAVLLSNLGYLKIDGGQLWPVFVIAWGLSWMLNPRRSGCCGRGRASRALGGPLGDPSHAHESWPTETSSNFHVSAVFSGSRRRVIGACQGGTAMSFFGGAQIDLRAISPSAVPVIIKADAIFGGIEILAPANWRVENEGTGIFGGFADETIAAGNATGPAGTLVVQGTALFGGVVVK